MSQAEKLVLKTKSRVKAFSFALNSISNVLDALWMKLCNGQSNFKSSYMYCFQWPLWFLQWWILASQNSKVTVKNSDLLSYLLRNLNQANFLTQIHDYLSYFLLLLSPKLKNFAGHLLGRKSVIFIRICAFLAFSIWDGRLGKKSEADA